MKPRCATRAVGVRLPLPTDPGDALRCKGEAAGEALGWRAPGVRGGGEASGEAAGEPPAERGVRAKIGDCDMADPAGDRCGSGDPAGRRAGVRGASERGLRGGLALGCDMLGVGRSQEIDRG